MEPWYESMKRHKLEGVVFHDELSSKFVCKYSTDRIQFRRAEIEAYPNYSLNDVRFWVYLAYITDCTESYLTKLFLTDLCDVEIKKNPFPFTTDKSSLYIGNEPGMTIGSNPWMMRKISKSYGAIDKFKPYLKNDLLNCGIVGAHRGTVMRFLRAMTAELQETDRFENANMAAANYVAYTVFKNKIVTGFPLVSRYKRYEDRNDVYFVHK